VVTIFGYADPLSVKQGGAVNFMLSATDSVEADVKLVRLIHGDTNPDGPGFVEEEIDISLPARLALTPQAVQRGSFATAKDAGCQLKGGAAGTLYAFVKPSLSRGGVQAIVSRWSGSENAGYVLFLEDGHVTFAISAGERSSQVRSPVRLVDNCWYLVAARWDFGTDRMEVEQIDLINPWNSQFGPMIAGRLDGLGAAAIGLNAMPDTNADFVIAGRARSDGMIGDLYNGKIDRVGLDARCLDRSALQEIARTTQPNLDSTIAFWDTTAGYTENGIGDIIKDVGPHGLDAHGQNRPVRAHTGYNYDGRFDCFALRPSQYGGISYNEDALTDCHWQSTLSIDIPTSLPSGVYALRLRAGGSEDHVTFFVTPQVARNRVAVVLPTYTYLAYANERVAIDMAMAENLSNRPGVVSQYYLDFNEVERFGLSVYDGYRDGSVACYTSSRRPIRNLRPRERWAHGDSTWCLSADLSLIWWLTSQNIGFDVLTDSEVHFDGKGALHPYDLVITGSHPEYTSTDMLDTYERYAIEGGNICYLGGNGFYWCSSVRPDEPFCIEVRKFDGSTPGGSRPGEGYMATNGERSGSWRGRGRAPQKTFGVGMAGQGFDYSTGFLAMPDSKESALAWMFRGIEEEAMLGDFGLSLGGAAGLEIDRYDLIHGTPPHARLLACSIGHSDTYPTLVEDATVTTLVQQGAREDPNVRADITFFTTSGGGAVFSAGSIAFSQSLPVNNANNNISVLLRNVIEGLLDGRARSGI